jgi:hypothetical protein
MISYRVSEIPPVISTSDPARFVSPVVRVLGRSRSARPEPSLRMMRCSCRDCGAHTMAHVGLVLTGGNCSNCGSYELVAIEPA